MFKRSPHIFGEAFLCPTMCVFTMSSLHVFTRRRDDLRPSSSMYYLGKSDERAAAEQADRAFRTVDDVDVDGPMTYSDLMT